MYPDPFSTFRLADTIHKERVRKAEQDWWIAQAERSQLPSRAVRLRAARRLVHRLALLILQLKP